MDKTNRLLFGLVFLALLFSACVPGSGQRVEIPTLAVLPSSTPTASDTPTITSTPLPSDTRTPSRTPTPNALETQVAGLAQTNAAEQSTLDTLLTRAAPTLTPIFTSTLTPTVPPTAVAIPPQWVYAQNPANLRTCPTSACEIVRQLNSGEAVSANGTIEGEALVTGNPVWYRVDSQGQEMYVYSTLVGVVPPTLPLAVAPPTFTPSPTAILPTNAPIVASTLVSPPQSSEGCPNVKASCSALTCAQAYACLAAGDSKLDGDKDGVPCESICN